MTMKHFNPNAAKTRGQVFQRLAGSEPSPIADATQGARTISFVFSNPGAVRGDNHQLRPGAWVANWKGMGRDGTTNFRRAPIVIEGHNYEGRSVGRVVELTELPDGRLVGTVQFADTEDGNALFDLYSTGFQYGVSIGYSVADATRSNDPTRGCGALDIARAELLEISLVPVGADENALAMGRAAK
jgi:HK97 family phage prohead protease